MSAAMLLPSRVRCFAAQSEVLQHAVRVEGPRERPRALCADVYCMSVALLSRAATSARAPSANTTVVGYR